MEEKKISADEALELVSEVHNSLAYNNVGDGRAKLAKVAVYIRGCVNDARVLAEKDARIAALGAQVANAWIEYERTRIAGDNPQGFPHIYFQRGYEAALAASPQPAKGEREGGGL